VCGGYAHLREVLADPADEEHDDMLAWLGLGKAADFDRYGFDLDKATVRSPPWVLRGDGRWPQHSPRSRPLEALRTCDFKTCRLPRWRTPSRVGPSPSCGRWRR
jgi:hypothetical protein